MPLTVVASTGTPVSRQGAIIAVQVALVSLAVIVYVLRIYARRFILHSIGIDDYIMAAAVFMSVALAATACAGTRFGWGRHLGDIPSKNFSAMLFLSWLSELLFTATASLLKISILFFYLRLGMGKTYRGIVCCTIGAIFAFMITFFLVTIFQCSPVYAYWDPTATNCINPRPPLLFHGIFNTAADFFVFVLPMPVVWRLQLVQRQRVALIGIFGIGLVACVVGALRLHYSIVTQNSNDSPWVGYYFWSFQCAEVNVGIVCASLPPLKQLVARFVPGFVTNIAGQSHSSNLRRGPSMPYTGIKQNNNNSRCYAGGKHTSISVMENVFGCTSVNEGRAGDVESREDLTGKDKSGIFVMTRLDLETRSALSEF